MNEENDRELVGQCLAGSERAFEMLVDRYEKVIFSVAYRMTSDFDASEDITQATFVKAFENLKRYDPRYKFFSWLYRIAVNESLNHLKHRMQTRELSPCLVSNERGPDETYVEAELARHIQEAMMELDPDYRTVVVLRHYGDCSYKQMAEILDLPEKKVKSRLFTARHLLRDILARRGILKDDSRQVH